MKQHKLQAARSEKILMNIAAHDATCALEVIQDNLGMQ
jgi:hypothetical protein